MTVLNAVDHGMIADYLREAQAVQREEKMYGHTCLYV